MEQMELSSSSGLCGWLRLTESVCHSSVINGDSLHSQDCEKKFDVIFRTPNDGSLSFRHFRLIFDPKLDSILRCRSHSTANFRKNFCRLIGLL